MNRKFTIALSSVVIGGMILSGSIPAFAGAAVDSSSTTAGSRAIDWKVQGDQPDGRGHDKMGGQTGGGISNDLAADLVKEGIISQEVADKINSYIEVKNTERKAEMEKVKAMTDAERKAYMESKKSTTTDKTEKKTSWLSDLVTEGILTQAQSDSIKEYQQKEMKAEQEEQTAKRQAAEKERMVGLVAAGVITQDTADAITAYNKTQEESRKVEMEKVKAMTETERKAYMGSKKSAKADGKMDPYAGLVEAGILTQAQADSIKAYDEKQREAKQEEQQAKRKEEMEAKLDGLVTAGTITADLKTKITEYLNSQEETRSAERKAEMEKVKAMTDAERKAYYESKKPAEKGEKISPLKALVDAGTLTQVQADAVAEALFQRSADKK